MHPAALTPNVAFRNSSLEVIGESGSFEQELPVLLAWCPANKCYTFLQHNLVSVEWLYCAAGEWTQVQFGNNFGNHKGTVIPNRDPTHGSSNSRRALPPAGHPLKFSLPAAALSVGSHSLRGLWHLSHQPSCLTWHC